MIRYSTAGEMVNLGDSSNYFFGKDVTAPNRARILLETRDNLTWFTPNLIRIMRKYHFTTVWSTLSNRSLATSLEPIGTHTSYGSYQDDWMGLPTAWVAADGAVSSLNTFLHEAGHFLNKYWLLDKGQGTANDWLTELPSFVAWHTAKVRDNALIDNYFRFGPSGNNEASGRSEFLAESFEWWMKGNLRSFITTSMISNADIAPFLTLMASWFGDMPGSASVRSEPATIFSSVSGMPLAWGHITASDPIILAFPTMGRASGTSTSMLSGIRILGLVEEVKRLKFELIIPTTTQEDDGNYFEAMYFQGELMDYDSKTLSISEMNTGYADTTNWIKNLESFDPGWGADRPVLVKVSTLDGNVRIGWDGYAAPMLSTKYA